MNENNLEYVLRKHFIFWKKKIFLVKYYKIRFQVSENSFGNYSLGTTLIYLKYHLNRTYVLIK